MRSPGGVLRREAGRERDRAARPDRLQAVADDIDLAHELVGQRERPVLVRQLIPWPEARRALCLWRSSSVGRRGRDLLRSPISKARERCAHLNARRALRARSGEQQCQTRRRFFHRRGRGCHRWRARVLAVARRARTPALILRLREVVFEDVGMARLDQVIHRDLLVEVRIYQPH